MRLSESVDALGFIRIGAEIAKPNSLSSRVKLCVHECVRASACAHVHVRARLHAEGLAGSCALSVGCIHGHVGTWACGHMGTWVHASVPVVRAAAHHAAVLQAAQIAVKRRAIVEGHTVQIQARVRAVA